MRRVVASLMLVVLSAACSGGGDPRPAGAPGGEPSKLVLDAATSTVEAGSSKVGMSVDIKTGPQSFSMVGDGAFDYRGKVGAMTFRLSGDEIPEAFSGFEMRFIKDTLFMKFPKEFAEIAPGLKEWVRADVEELSKQSGFSLPGLNSLAGQDPASVLNFTRGAESVTEVGPGSVRGVATTHYKMTIDVKKALEAFPEDARGGLDSMFSDAGIKSIPMELWLDAEGRARRLRFALDLAKFAGAVGAGSTGQEGSAAIGIEFYEFGSPVSVSAPPAGSVSEYEEFARLGKT